MVGKWCNFRHFFILFAKHIFSYAFLFFGVFCVCIYDASIGFAMLIRIVPWVKMLVWFRYRHQGSPMGEDAGVCQDEHRWCQHGLRHAHQYSLSGEGAGMASPSIRVVFRVRGWYVSG